MSWRRRLAELVAAGGALAACDSPQGPSFCGNALPDPCICDRTPLDAGQCVAEARCQAEGHQWAFYPTYGQPDAALGYFGVCLQPDAPRPDAAIDAPVDSNPGDAPHD